MGWQLLIKCQKKQSCSVARWYIFEPKIPIWVNFGGLGVEKVRIFYGHLEYITAIKYTEYV
jgi:hypothetical protein